jgi:sugar transferase EpsL
VTLFAKRFLDILLSTALLLFLWPVMLCASIAIVLAMGRPVVFRQQRIGFKGQPFPILKFRTMLDEQDDDGRVLPDNERLTPLGLFLRSTSIDELPQLINVLKGQMSLIGPRPLLRQFVEYCTPEQARRSEVKPGITGLAQISGRRELSYAERFALDVWYIDHWSFRLDMKILLATASVTLKREGATDRSETVSSIILGYEGESSGSR